MRDADQHNRTRLRIPNEGDDMDAGPLLNSRCRLGKLGDMSNERMSTFKEWLC